MVIPILHWVSMFCATIVGGFALVIVLSSLAEDIELGFVYNYKHVLIPMVGVVVALSAMVGGGYAVYTMYPF